MEDFKKFATYFGYALITCILLKCFCGVIKIEIKHTFDSFGSYNSLKIHHEGSR